MVLKMELKIIIPISITGNHFGTMAAILKLWQSSWIFSQKFYFYVNLQSLVLRDFPEELKESMTGENFLQFMGTVDGNEVTVITDNV